MSWLNSHSIPGSMVAVLVPVGGQSGVTRYLEQIRRHARADRDATLEYKELDAIIIRQ